MSEPVYDDAEVEAILRAALDRPGAAEGLTHAELAEVAAEVGLSPEELEKAAKEVLGARVARREREQAEAVAKARRRARRRGFAQHVVTWGIVGTGLVALDYVTNGSVTWALYPIIGWGIGVGLHGAGLAFRDEEKEVARIARDLRKRREREEQKARDKERRRGRSAAEVALEDALDKGIALLLHKVADKLEAAADVATRKDSELNRFIAKQRGEPVRVEPARDPARARVDASEPEPHEVEAERRARRERERQRS
ncbi:MAG: 2TM domain-containing protein [Myxococcales bacterium]|nr:2TM domain-containing protein [Myxococcales bacterium]